MDNGWIKLHRKLLDNPLFTSPNYTLVWLYLLLNATHKQTDVMFEGKRITLLPGQLTCGANQIAKKMGVTRSSVERALGRFQVEDMVEVQPSNKCSLVTVKKWASYQTTEEGVEEQVRNKRGTSEEQVRTKQERKNEENVRMEEPDSDVERSSPTPAQEATDFFEDVTKQNQCVEFLLAKGVQEETARSEIAKFVSYWTEPSKSGKKQRWQLEKTFEVRRRLVTWLTNMNKRFNSASKGTIQSL